MSILNEDLNSIATYDIPWENMRNTTVLVTGATGLIGSLIIKSLFRANELHNLNVKLIALVRNFDYASNFFHDYDIQYLVQDIKDEILLEEKIDYIIHCAANTNSKDMITFPVENIETAIYGTNNILKLAIQKQVKSVVYLSSMEAYGITNPDLERVSEVDLGYINLKSARSCYPESKRMCEVMCYSYFSEYNVPVKIARLAQVFGAGVRKDDTRVFAQFAKSVIDGKDIVLHTDGKSVGNYCYTADAIKGILLLLHKGENGEVYNITNEKTNMTIREMAELVAEKVANGKISVITNIPEELNKYGYAPSVKMKLSSEKIRQLGWVPLIGLETMYENMIKEFNYD